MVPPLSALSLALCHETLQGVGNHKMGTIKSQNRWKPKCFFRGCDHKMANRKKKLPLLLTLFAIHCLTKASAFVPQCSKFGNKCMKPYIKRILLTIDLKNI